jgi:hypothetical protein
MPRAINTMSLPKSKAGKEKSDDLNRYLARLPVSPFIGNVESGPGFNGWSGWTGCL